MQYAGLEIYKPTCNNTILLKNKLRIYFYKIINAVFEDCALESVVRYIIMLDFTFLLSFVSIFAI